ncbi:MAG TPA: PIN domain-containing protein [Pseudonocardiaceae bacterium]|nr:PIN domain-containing protein [Pseudonocardiaceae bacterium]
MCPVSQRPTRFTAHPEHDLFRPLWSEAIFDEIRRNVVAKRNVDPSAFDRTLSLMNDSFDGALVENWKPVFEDLNLPDADDRHVLAAAIVGGGQAIVTFNLADFPTGQLAPYHVDAIHPDAFLLDQLDLAPARVLATLTKQAQRYRNPAMDLSGLLARLERCGVSSFTEEVRRLAL